MLLLDIIKIERLTGLKFTELNYSAIEKQRKNKLNYNFDNEVDLAFESFYLPLDDEIDQFIFDEEDVITIEI